MIKYGLIPELVGRLPVVAALTRLTSQCWRGSHRTKNALIKQYKQLFTLDNVELEFTDEALSAIAEKTSELNTGARGLRAVMEELLTNLMFEAPSDYKIEKIVINKDYVENNGKPEIVKNPNRKPVRPKVPSRVATPDVR